MRDLPLPPRRRALLIVPPTMDICRWMLRLCVFRVLLLSEAFNLYCYASLVWYCCLLSIPNVSRRMLCAPSLCRPWLMCWGVVGPGRGCYKRSLDQRPLLRRSCREPDGWRLSSNPPQVLHCTTVYIAKEPLGQWRTPLAGSAGGGRGYLPRIGGRYIPSSVLRGRP